MRRHALPLLSAALLAGLAAAPAARGAVRTNTWIRPIGGDPKASVAGNWSLGHVPKEGEVALFSARHPTAAIWDAAAPRRIGGLATEAGYVAVLTFETSPSGPLPTLEVDGDVDLAGGAVTHPQNGDAPAWRLSIEAGGSIRIGPEALVSVSGKGFAPGKGPSPGLQPGWGASHGGQGAPRAGADIGRPPATCGSLFEPSAPGSGGTVAEGAPATFGHGGGVVRLVAGGDLTVLGKIRADADRRDAGGVLLGGAAGGSIDLRAGGAVVVGETGAVSADGGAAYGQGGGGGGGGRIAIRYGADSPSVSNIPHNNNARFRVHASGGTGDTRNRDNGRVDTHIRAASGTIYLERTGEGRIPRGGTIAVYGSNRPSLAFTRLPADVDGDSADALRDAALAVLDGGTAVLVMNVGTRSLLFGGSGALDLNGNRLETSRVAKASGGAALEETGTHRTNDHDALAPVVFSGGTLAIRPYFEPSL